MANFLVARVLHQSHEGLHVGPLDDEEEVGVEVASRDPDGRLLKHLRLTDVHGIDNELVSRVTPDEIDQNTFEGVRATLATHSSSNLPETASTIMSHLRFGVVIPAQKLIFLMPLPDLMRERNSIGEQDYAQIAIDGYFLHHLNQAASESDAEAVARCTLDTCKVL